MKVAQKIVAPRWRHQTPQLPGDRKLLCGKQPDIQVGSTQAPKDLVGKRVDEIVELSSLRASSGRTPGHNTLPDLGSIQLDTSVCTEHPIDNVVIDRICEGDYFLIDAIQSIGISLKSGPFG